MTRVIYRAELPKNVRVMLTAVGESFDCNSSVTRTIRAKAPKQKSAERNKNKTNGEEEVGFCGKV